MAKHLCTIPLGSITGLSRGFRVSARTQEGLGHGTPGQQIASLGERVVGHSHQPPQGHSITGF